MAEGAPRVAVVTGAAGAVGGAAVRALRTRGFTVVAATRAGGSGLEEDLEVAGAPPVEIERFDLARPASVRAAAARIVARHPSIGAVVLAAAVLARRRVVTPEGFEQMFATNQLGPFLLVHELLPALRRADGASVLTVTAPSTAAVDLNDLGAERRFSPVRVFGSTKAENLLFALELARRERAHGVRSNAVFPGVVRSGLMREAPALVRLFAYAAGRAPDAAGDAIAALVADPAFRAQSGVFFRLTTPIEIPESARDPELARRLWTECERLLGVAPATDSA